MTKTQAKAILRKLYESDVLGQLNTILTDCIEAINGFKDDVEETRDNIEPYENKDDLTEQQQERYDWFDDLYNDLDELADALDTMQGDLNEFEERLAWRD